MSTDKQPATAFEVVVGMMAAAFAMFALYCLVAEWMGGDNVPEPMPAYGSSIPLSDREVYESGQVCLLLDEGANLTDAWQVLTQEQGIGSDMAVALIESAIHNHCPRYEGLLS